MQTPTAFFGFAPGSDRHIIHWDKLCAYYRMLAAESDRVRCIEVGKTTLGKPFLELIISAPESVRPSAAEAVGAVPWASLAASARSRLVSAKARTCPAAAVARTI